VVQHVTGQPYQDYVRSQVLAPMDITDMRIEEIGPHYFPAEAHRYGPNGVPEYPGGRHPIDPPAGSWVASATDMAKFLTAIDGSRGQPFLTPAIREEMLGPLPPPLVDRKNGSHFGLGWDAAVREKGGFRYSKNGGVAGIHTFIEHRPDGVDWVVLLNGSGEVPEAPKLKALGQIIKRVHEAIARTHHWPERDLLAK
jgi:CubicO group peptidase (beta-lactamase class C family)